MDEKQLISEIAGMFREQSAAMAEYIDQRIDGIGQRIDGIDQRIDGLAQDLRSEIRDTKQEIMLTIENDITKRLDVLADGYQLVHEKQWQLEHRIQRLEKRLDELTA